ncbi:MAG: hypothetical protein LBH27_00030 [Endomicrobium sp.]|jgi:cell division protein FtsX|nr:hypothetical protein [Endomicrobium sp.]
MKHDKFAVNAELINDFTKFLCRTILCFLCILVFRHYCQIKFYSDNLQKNLDVVIFFDENSSKNSNINAIDRIKKTNLVFIKQYVDTNIACEKSMKNLLLKNFLTTHNNFSIQPYAIATPRFDLNTNIQKNKYILNTKKIIEKIEHVDEVVFNIQSFEQCTSVENLLFFYKNVFFIIVVCIFILLFVKLILLFIYCKSGIKKIVTDSILQVSSFVVAFFIFLITCTFKSDCTLFINAKYAVISAIFAVIFGVILN